MNVYQLSDKELDSNRVNQAANLAWEHLRNFLYFRLQNNASLAGCIPEVSLEAAEKRSAIGRNIETLLSNVDDESLPHDLALTAKLVRYYAKYWKDDVKRYWLSYDVMGIMFYGPFIQTAYTGGFVFKSINEAMQGFSFEKESDADTYLSLLADIARFLHQIHARTQGQAERGIRIHQAQLAGVRDMLVGIKSAADKSFRVSSGRLSAVSYNEALQVEIVRRIEHMILPGFDALIAQLNEDYERQAPQDVGMGVLPGGDEVYSDLLRMHTTLEMTPEQVHQAGHKRMARIEAAMSEVRSKLGFGGSAEDFKCQIRKQPSAIASSPDDIGEKMRRHKDRIGLRFDEYFAQRTPYEFDLLRLDETLEGSMTWGFYQAPTTDEPRGLYRYNGSKLDSQAVLGAASLVFHELVPGHHLHFTLQSQNTDLHPVRRYAFVNAFNEGWAEYAATLAGEMGLYDDPYDCYGRLIMDSFLTSRLVVDTGMNALGWTLERARAYMSEHTLCTEAEIASDTLRYSCSIPGQALAYKLGDEEILRMRSEVQKALGGKFSYREFHSAILGVGSLPIPVLEWHLNRLVNWDLD